MKPYNTQLIDATDREMMTGVLFCRNIVRTRQRNSQQLEVLSPHWQHAYKDACGKDGLVNCISCSYLRQHEGGIRAEIVLADMWQALMLWNVITFLTHCCHSSCFLCLVWWPRRTTHRKKKFSPKKKSFPKKKKNFLFF